MITHVSFRTLRALKTLVPAVGTIATLLAASAAHAQLISYGNIGQPTEAQFNALGVNAVPITGPPMTATQPVYMFSAAGQTLTLSNGATPANGKGLQRRNQQGPGSMTGGNFAGNFAVDTPLIDSVVNSSTTNPADGLNIAFSSPVSAFGFNFDPSTNLAPTTFTLVVNTLGGGQTPFSRTGVVSSDADDGTAPFFGVQDTDGNLITSVLLYGTADVPPGFAFNNPIPNDFAVGLLRFGVTAPPPLVPEPGNIALLMGMAVTGAGCLARRKRQSVNK